MQDLFSAILADPKTWAGIFGCGVLWIWREVKNSMQHRKTAVEIARLRLEGEECRIDRAALRKQVDSMQGAIDVLTELHSKEISHG